MQLACTAWRCLKVNGQSLERTRPTRPRLRDPSVRPQVASQSSRVDILIVTRPAVLTVLSYLFAQHGWVGELVTSPASNKKLQK